MFSLLMPRKQISDKGAPEGMVMRVERECIINCIVHKYTSGLKDL